jgi:FkbM family methyltransferase
MKPTFDNYDSLRAAVSKPRQIDATRPIWIFGAGGFGKSLCSAMLGRGISVAGFVETTPQTTSILNLPVVEWSTLVSTSPNAQIALGILNRSTPYDELLNIAANAGFTDVLMPWDTYDVFEKELGWRFWLSTRDFLISGLDRISQVSLKLADQESRDTLMRITAFRLGLDTDFSGKKTRENQYFNDLTLNSLRGKSISYVDCGAYNGDTYIDLMDQQSINCDQAFLMEPDPENFNALVSNVTARKGSQSVICLPLAAADKYSILTFSSGQGEGGAIGVNGNMHIAAVALDQLLSKAPINFIKLDVEGAEAQVLKGARSIIERNRPTLALSLYHNPQDIWELPELLFQMCFEYNLFIRQHFFNSFDCVLYAVPKN